MGRGNLIVVAAAGLLIGFALGRSLGGHEVVFPEVDETRTVAEMEAEVLSVLAEPLASVRASSLARLFEGMTAENAPGAANALESRAGRWDPVDMQVFLASWVRVDPQAAMERIGRWPIQSRREMGINIAVREWAASGGWLEAVEYIQTSMDPEVREVALGPLVRGWALSGDVLGAEKQARRIYEAGSNPAVVDALVRGVLHVGGPEGVLELMRSLDATEDDAFEQRIARVGLDLVTREDPSLAPAAFDVLSAEGVGEWLEPSILRIAQIWRNQDPEAATVWLVSLAPGEARDEALTRTVAEWGMRDFEQARTWVEDQVTPGLTSEGAWLAPTPSLLVIGLIPRLSRVDPRAAAGWAERLPAASSMRLPMLQRVARYWGKEDQDAALAWIDGLDLESADRKRLIGHVTSRDRRD